MAVDVVRAHGLPAQSLTSPLIVLHSANGMGLFGLDGNSSAPLLLGDGQHRLAKAFFDQVACLPAWLLDQAQSDRYLTIRRPRGTVRPPLNVWRSQAKHGTAT